MVFLASIAKFLMLVHAGASIALVGATTHNGILAFSHLRGGQQKSALQRRYVSWMFWLFLLTFVIGLLIYPAYRVHVRAEYFDLQLPFATRLFEIKEHWLAIALGILAIYYPLSRRIDVSKRGMDVQLYNFLGVLMVLIIWYAMVASLLLVSYRSL